MINTTYDYTGRKVDLEFFQTENPPMASKALTMTMTDKGTHRRVAGIQKLVQRYLLIFMTPKGSVLHAPGFGVDFMSAVNRGLLQSRTNVVQYFALSNMDASQQLLAEDDSAVNSSLPDDERYSRSYLMDYNIDTSQSKLYLKILIESRAGSTYTFVVPAA